MSQGNTGQPTRLTDGHILVGNSSGIATDVAMSGDVTITDAGVTTIKSSVALAGSPTTTTQGTSDNSTKIATTAFVKSVSTPIVSSTTANTIPTFSNTTGTLQDTGVIIDANNALYNDIKKVQTVSTTTYTLLATDTGTTILFTNSAGCTVTLPNNLSVGLNVHFIQGGNGQVLLSPASGASIQAALSSGIGTSGVGAEIWVTIVTNSGTNAAYILGGTVAVQTPVAPTPAAGTVIQSIQPFTCTIAAGQTSNTATITAVVLANSCVRWNGITGQASTYAAETCQCYPVMTNTTTITVQRNTSDATNSLTYYGVVIEYASGVVKTNNQGTIAIGSGATSNTATISSINTGNSYIEWNGQNFSAATDDANFARCQGALAITNSTTLTASRQTSSTSTLTVSYACIEFNTGVLNSSTQAITATGNAGAGVAFPSTFTTPLQTMLVYCGAKSTGTGTDSHTIVMSQDVGGAGILNVQTAAGTVLPQYYVVEFLSGTFAAKMQGNPTIAAGQTSYVDTIESFNTSKSFIVLNGQAASTSLSAFNTSASAVYQSSTTGITSIRNTLHATIATKTPYTIYRFT